MPSSPFVRLRRLTLAATLLLPVLPLAAQGPAAPPAPPVSAPATATPPTPTPAPPRTSESAIIPVNRNPGRHRVNMARIRAGKIDLLFLGDSITDWWPRNGKDTWAKFAPYHPADFGIAGERTEDLLWRITNGELDGISPKVTVLMIGTNNVGQHQDERPEWTAAGVKKIVETIHAKLPETRLLLLGVFPRGMKADPVRGKIDAINAEISKLADGKTTRYLDVGHVFLDAQGEIPRDVMSDLLHPGAKGYQLWYDAMQPTLDEMMK